VPFCFGLNGSSAACDLPLRIVGLGGSWCMLEAGDAAGPQDFLCGAVLLIARFSVWVFRVD